MFFRSKSEKPEAEKHSSTGAAALSAAAPTAPQPALTNTMPSMSSAHPNAPLSSGHPASVGSLPESTPRTGATKKDPASAFAQAISILMRAPQTRDLKLADLEWLILPALKNQQIAIAEAKLKDTPGNVPVAVLLWAMVSPDVERRMIADKSAIPRMEPGDWKSGDIPWIVAALGPADILKNVVAQLVSGPLGGRRVRGRVADATGTIRVQEFG